MKYKYRILVKHQNPNAFNRQWLPLADFRVMRGDFDFRYYMYEIYGVEYHRDTEEFRQAVDRYKMMIKLTR